MHYLWRRGAVAPAATLALVTAAALTAGCAGVQPEPVAAPDLRATARTDRAAAQADMEPIKGRVTLEEAIARALKYNLERRSRMMEEAIALNQLDVSQYDMLPRLLAQAGYRWRDEELITRSKDSVTGQPALNNPFISTDREHVLYDLGLTWNLLDLGTSYYGAKQNADRVLIALERRRKAMHVLIQDVRTAFWRTASAQKLQKQVQEAIALAEDALKDARKAETERVRSPVESLRYQRQVLENLRLLETTNQELTTARLELAHLMNIPLAYDLVVEESADTVSRAMLEIPVERLEEVAVARNAELREHFYNARIARAETRRVLMRMFPGVSFNYNLKYDTDSYLVNQRWNEAGASISFNLFNLLSGPAQKRLADAGVALADQRRMATQMAILAQVHIARLQYANALNQYERAQAVADVDQRIVEIMSKREQAQVQSKLETVANQTTAILSLLRRYQALSQAHAAASRLQATLGVEPEFDSVQQLPLAQLQGIVSRALKAWNRGDLPRDGAPARSEEPGSQLRAGVSVAAKEEKPGPARVPAQVAGGSATLDANAREPSAIQASEVAAGPAIAKQTPASDPAPAAQAQHVEAAPAGKPVRHGESVNAQEGAQLPVAVAAQAALDPRPATAVDAPGPESVPDVAAAAVAPVAAAEVAREAEVDVPAAAPVAAQPPAQPSQASAANGNYLVFRVGSGAAAGRKMYKWVDDSGTTRYADRPPAGYMSVVVTVAGPEAQGPSTAALAAAAH